MRLLLVRRRRSLNWTMFRALGFGLPITGFTSVSGNALSNVIAARSAVFSLRKRTPV